MSNNKHKRPTKVAPPLTPQKSNLQSFDSQVINSEEDTNTALGCVAKSATEQASIASKATVSETIKSTNEQPDSREQNSFGKQQIFIGDSSETIHAKIEEKKKKDESKKEKKTPPTPKQPKLQKESNVVLFLWVLVPAIMCIYDIYMALTGQFPSFSEIKKSGFTVGTVNFLQEQDMYSNLCTALGLITIVHALRCAVHWRKKNNPTNFQRLFILFPIAVICAWIHGFIVADTHTISYLYLTFLDALDYLSFIAVFIVVATMEDTKIVKTLYKVFLGEMVVFAFIMILQHFDFKPVFNAFPAKDGSVFKQFNYFGYMLCMTIISLFGTFLYTSRKNTTRKVAVCALIAFFTQVLIWNNTFGAFLATVLAIPVVYLFYYKNRKRRLKEQSVLHRMKKQIIKEKLQNESENEENPLKIQPIPKNFSEDYSNEQTQKKQQKVFYSSDLSPVVFFGIPVVLSLFGIIPETQNFAPSIIQFFTDVNNVTESKNPEDIERAGTGRMRLWMDSLKRIQKNPLGVGPGGFVGKYAIANHDSPHNEYIQVAGYLGIPTLIVYLTGILATAKLSWTKLTKAPVDKVIIGHPGSGQHRFLVKTKNGIQVTNSWLEAEEMVRQDKLPINQVTSDNAELKIKESETPKILNSQSTIMPNKDEIKKSQDLPTLSKSETEKKSCFMKSLYDKRHRKIDELAMDIGSPISIDADGWVHSGRNYIVNVKGNLVVLDGDLTERPENAVNLYEDNGWVNTGLDSNSYIEDIEAKDSLHYIMDKFDNSLPDVDWESMNRHVQQDREKAESRIWKAVQNDVKYQNKVKEFRQNGISRVALVAGGVVVAYLISACFGNMQYSTYPFFCIFMGILVNEIHKK